MITEVSIPSVISEGTKVRGEIILISVSEIFGVVEGEITQQSLETLRIGRTGWVNGKILSQGPVVVEGRVEGNIVSETRITLSPTAVVHGQLRAPTIDIAAGAIVEGELEMTDKEPMKVHHAA